MQLFLIKIVQNFKNCKIRENTGKRIACGAGKWYNKKMEEKTDIQKVFIAGGTGFLGMPAAEKFEKAGIGVCSASLSGGKNCVKFDLFSAAEEEIAALVGKCGADALLYALGPDDRATPPAPAYAFFHERLAVQSEKICRAAKRAGVKKIVALGSYFAHFNALYGGKLEKHHPYIRARAEQERRLLALSDEKCAVCMLELPYIFGVTAGRAPLWRESFLSHYDRYRTVFITRGGTAATTAEGVAETCVAAALYGAGGARYPVGGVNITYKELLEKMLFYAKDGRKVRLVPARLAALGAKGILKEYAAAGCESGLNPAKLMTEIQNRYFYIDAEKTETALHFAELGFSPVREIDAAVRASMEACYPERFR